MRFFLISMGAALLSAATARAQSAGEDEYTLYELLAPETASFRILYDVTAVTPGARFFFNPIRKGSEARDESVTDLATGAPLRFELVSGTEARDAGEERADPETSYIKVHLKAPVPEGGEVRVRIDKTYRDPKSYYPEGDLVVFDRSLGIKRNAIALPDGHELVSCNIPSQVLEDDDGRIRVSFLNTYPAAAPLVLKARKLPPTRARGPSPEPPRASSPAPTPLVWDFPERARETAEIVYLLEPPETHSFRLYHDFTESREGVGQYLNVVRTGSKVSGPSARLLDTGAPLETRTLRGNEIKEAGLGVADVGPESEVVVVSFPAVEKGGSRRIRVEETYTDPGRYFLSGDELVWRRSFGRTANDLVLPADWFLTASSIPATISETDDGRIRLSFVNPRPDAIDVLVKARRR
jgi:hypothetical protein